MFCRTMCAIIIIIWLLKKAIYGFKWLKFNNVCPWCKNIPTLNMGLTCSRWVALVKGAWTWLTASIRALAVLAICSISTLYSRRLCFSLATPEWELTADAPTHTRRELLLTEGKQTQQGKHFHLTSSAKCWKKTELFQDEMWQLVSSSSYSSLKCITAHSSVFHRTTDGKCEQPNALCAVYFN